MIELLGISYILLGVKVSSGETILSLKTQTENKFQIQTTLL